MSHTRQELRLSVTDPDGGTWEVAATAHLPASDVLPSRPTVLVAVPGSGYGRRYYDIAEPGYSQAEHHTALGTIVVAVDPLGVGDSDVPPLETTTMATVAATTHEVVTTIVSRLRAGALAPGYPAVSPSAVVGLGQSMGGFIVIGTQAAHRTFDAIAALGSALSGTRLATAPDAAPVDVPPGTPPDEAAALILAHVDWRYNFHWEDELPALVEADVAAGLPIRHTAPPWGSLTSPGLVNTLITAEAIAPAAAAIDVPVLLGSGERDVVGPAAEELAALTSATDISWVVFPRMAHMHNFAGTPADHRTK